MIIDMHAHYGLGLQERSAFGPLYRLEEPSALVGHLDRLGIAQAVVFPPRWVRGRVDPNYEEANQEIADAVSRYPDRLVGFARVNPNYGERAVAEFAHGLRRGLRGLKLDPETEGFAPTNFTLLDPLMELCRQQRAPVIIHTGFHPSQPLLCLPLAERFPDVTFVLAHMGLRLGADAIIVARRAPNVYLETSGETPTLVHRAIRQVGPDRVLFGSDFPFSILEAELEKIQTLPGTSEADRAKVLGTNARRLLGLN